MPKKINISGIVFSDMAEDVERQIDEANGEDIEVFINSPGGMVTSGLKIFNLLEQYDATVTTHISGLAASMASYIALAGNEVVADSNSIFMIHNARGLAIGDQLEMKKMANILESMSNILAQEYSEKTGKSIEEIKEKMNEESFFFGREMKKYGFVDRIIKVKNKKKRRNVKAKAIVEIEECMAELKKYEMSDDDFNQAAAFLNLDLNEVKNKKEETNTPDEGNFINHNKEENMPQKGLKELMAEDPGLKAEVEALEKEKYDQGIKDGKAEIEEKIKKASPYLGKTEYPDAIKNLALEVITGKEDPVALKGAIVAYDATKEKEKSDDAGDENKEDTPPDSNSPDAISEDGTIKNEADYQASIKNVKGVI